ncbi:hypothetical protein [Ochrobactrum chromiisoli]|uniref:Uncharacterized protein n=1 Tax=Ochrobactrum chromiisoli TaxID=2993941 RepID=A0ABT3QV35_9HYPH|nr:hypothetical protein [Ochrobactrum chromiisoli]MCX2699365.1 hypothetical protein [Ochrobactrum chromiisoli]
MHSTYQITGNDLARALTGLTKPAPKARDNTRQKRVMQMAWKLYRAKQAENLKEAEYAKANLPADRFEKWLKNQTGFNAKLFGHALSDAYASVAREDNAHLFTVTSDESRFIGSDRRWR